MKYAVGDQVVVAHYDDVGHYDTALKWYVASPIGMVGEVVGVSLIDQYELLHVRLPGLAAAAGAEPVVAVFFDFELEKVLPG